jgi:hypothetical protein
MLDVTSTATFPLGTTATVVPQSGCDDSVKCPMLIRWARIRIVAAHGRVIAVRVLRAKPGGVVARVTVTEAVTEVEAKKSAADAEYGVAPESTKLPIEARIEVPTREGTPNAEACARERVPYTEVGSAPRMPAASVSTCGHGELCKRDGQRGGGHEVP